VRCMSSTQVRVKLADCESYCNCNPGRAPMAPAAATADNTVYHARLPDFPFTPEQMLSAVKR
jgi:hypothetical protein